MDTRPTILAVQPAKQMYSVSALAGRADTRITSLSGFALDRSLRLDGDVRVHDRRVCKVKLSIFHDTSKNLLAIGGGDHAPRNLSWKAQSFYIAILPAGQVELPYAVEGVSGVARRCLPDRSRASRVRQSGNCRLCRGCGGRWRRRVHGGRDRSHLDVL
jgi:hypothetical protein